MRNIKYLIIFILFLSLPQANASELKDAMEELGQSYNALARAIIVDKDLGPSTMQKSQTVNNLLHASLNLTPNWDGITRDPVRQEQLLAMYRKLMSDSLSASYDLEYAIRTQDLQRATDNVMRLREIRSEGHGVFRP